MRWAEEGPRTCFPVAAMLELEIREACEGSSEAGV